MPGLLPLIRRVGDGRETITTAYLPPEANYSTHMPNEKPRPLGGTGASELALLDRRGMGLVATYPTVVSTRAEANRSPCGVEFTSGKRSRLFFCAIEAKPSDLGRWRRVGERRVPVRTTPERL